MPSVRAAAWLLTADTASLDEDQVQFVEQLCSLCPEVRLGQQLIGAFLAIVRARHEAVLDGWFGEVEASRLPELVSFAAGCAVMSRRCAPPSGWSTATARSRARSTS